LRARADELEVGAVLLRADAAREREAARTLRAKASELRTRAKAVAVARPSSVKRGRLFVTALTSCDVEIDGVPRGTAPVVSLPLAEGVHVVTCRGEGIPTRVRRVEITENRPARVSFEDRPASTPLDPFS
jgi:hypothetical protein